jgi:hypothetical protein
VPGKIFLYQKTDVHTVTFWFRAFRLESATIVPSTIVNDAALQVIINYKLMKTTSNWTLNKC